MAKRNLYKKAPQQNTACCPIIKVKMNDIDGLEREAQERISYSEKNIDPERSALNLYVHGLDMDGNPVINGAKFKVPLKKRISNRIEHCGARIRTDKKKLQKGFVERGQNTKESVMAIGIELQVSHELAMDMLREDGVLDSTGRIAKGRSLPKNGKTYRFFLDAYTWVCDRYGEENVVGAYIHLDEYTPHMHVFVVPIAFKPRMYKKKVLFDQNGNVLMASRLDAKGLFGPKALKQLWKDFGAEMQKYGATAAKGLLPKGSYDKVASMDAIIGQKKQQLDDIETSIEEGRKEAHRLQEYRQRLSEDIRPFEMVHTKVVKKLQQIVDEDDPASAVTIVDYDIFEEDKVATSEYGEKTPYISRTYRILGVINGEERELIVDMNDYYNATNDPLKKAISRFFLKNIEIALFGKEIETTLHKSKKYGMKR